MQIYPSMNQELVMGLKELIDKGKSLVLTDSKKVEQLLRNNGIHAQIDLKNKILKDWRFNRYNLLNEKVGQPSNYEDYRHQIRNYSQEQSKSIIREISTNRDELAAQIVHTIDDLQKAYNLSVNRLQELYSIHFPEIVDLIQNPSTLCKIIIETKNRSDISEDFLKSMNLEEDKIQLILKLTQNSMGGDLSETDIDPIKGYAKTVLDQSDKLQIIEKWIDNEMEAIAPNITAVAGANVGARLISAFGSIYKLAMRSSSKIQTVGAERALYAALKRKGSPPKHGIIFQIPEIGNSPFWLRGKLARAYSGKIAIAARLDAFGGEFLGETYRENLRELESSLRLKYPNPPVKVETSKHRRKPRHRKRRRSKK